MKRSKLSLTPPLSHSQLSARYRRWLALPRPAYRLVTGLTRDVLFIWVPKCAGSSIYTTLVKHGCAEKRWETPLAPFENRGMVTFGHVGITQLLSAGVIARSYFRRAFKFAFVRNPFDRAVSLFHYLKKFGSEAVPPAMTFEGFCHTLDRREFPPVGLYNHHGLNQCNPMVRWLFDDAGRPLADFIGRHETVDRDFQMLCRQIGMRSHLPRHNTTEHRPYREYYTNTTRQIIERVYEEDLEAFGYEF